MDQSEKTSPQTQQEFETDLRTKLKMVEMQIEEMRKGNEIQQEESQCSRPPTQQDIRELEEDNGEGVGPMFTPEATVRSSVVPVTTGNL